LWADEIKDSRILSQCFSNCHGQSIFFYFFDLKQIFLIHQNEIKSLGPKKIFSPLETAAAVVSVFFLSQRNEEVFDFFLLIINVRVIAST
jgi:hypothetical protein